MKKKNKKRPKKNTTDELDIMLASYIKENQSWPKQIEQALASIRKINLFPDFERGKECY